MFDHSNWYRSYQKILEDQNIDQIETILKRDFDLSNCDDYDITDDGIVNLEGIIRYKKSIRSSRIPIKFGEIKGSFFARSCGLISLINSPKIVSEVFNVENNKLTSLEGGPNHVGSSFYCGENRLKSLEGGPTNTVQRYECHENRLISLKGAPEICGVFVALKNRLTNLENCPKITGLINLERNPLQNFKGLRIDSNKSIVFNYNSNLPLLRLVGLLLIMTENEEVQNIINKYSDAGMNNRTAILACQKELIAAGFESNAKW